VTVTDGTVCPICSDVNGQEWTLAEALDYPVGHPACVRSFAPVLTDTPGTPATPATRSAPFEHHLLSQDPSTLATRCAARSEQLVDVDDPTPERRDPTDDDLDDGSLLHAPLDDLIRLVTGGTP